MKIDIGPLPLATDRYPDNSKHEIRISYTNDDDGIHLECACGFEQCLGHTPTLEKVNDAARWHHRNLTDSERSIEQITLEP